MSRIDKDNAPSLVMIRFRNLMGALVLVQARELGQRTEFWWHCQGCMESHDGGSFGLNRTRANDHAAACRALPQTEETTAH